MITDAVRNILDGTPIAHVATVAADGAPHSVPVWIGTHGDHIVFFTGPGSAKARNLRHDPRVAISLTPPDDPFTPVIIRGTVTRWVDGDDGWALVDELSVKYTGSPYPRDDVRVAALVEPTRQIVGMGG